MDDSWAIVCKLQTQQRDSDTNLAKNGFWGDGKECVIDQKRLHYNCVHIRHKMPWQIRRCDYVAILRFQSKI
jgi:hypothetical protein